jgi:dehydrogenase/reductase SDR family protein 4
MAAVPQRRFEGKVVVVTASTAGIGLGIATRLAREGAHVMISSRKHSSVEEVVSSLRSQGLEVAGCACHVGSSQQRHALVQETLRVRRCDGPRTPTLPLLPLPLLMPFLPPAGPAPGGDADGPRQTPLPAPSFCQIYGRIDHLVSNAAVNPSAGPILDSSDAAIDKVRCCGGLAGLLLQLLQSRVWVPSSTDHHRHP